MSTPSGCEVAGRMGQIWPPVLYPPYVRVFLIRADKMTVEQTAEWVRNLSIRNLWQEANEYARNFAEHKIGGYLLQKLTNKTLEEKLGIVKCEHRLKIMFAINCLFPKNEPSKHFAEENIPQKYERSLMPESDGETGSVEDTPSSMKLRSPSVITSSSKNATPAVHPVLCKDHTGKSRWNSGRATPSHPVFYKTLRKAILRSGTGGLAKNLGYLPRDSIVAINQIKGRSGRVAFKDNFGSYRTAGWVTLYAKKNEQLLRRYKPGTNDREFVLSSFSDVMVE